MNNITVYIGRKVVINMLKMMKYEVTVNVLAPYRSSDGCMERLNKLQK